MRNGWFRDSYRHSLASRGIKTSFKPKYNFYEVNQPEQVFQMKEHPEQDINNLTEEEFKKKLKHFKSLTGVEKIDSEYLNSFDNKKKYIKFDSPLDMKLWLESVGHKPIEYEEETLNRISDDLVVSGENSVNLPYVVISGNQVIGGDGLEYIDAADNAGETSIPLVVLEDVGVLQQ